LNRRVTKKNADAHLYMRIYVCIYVFAHMYIYISHEAIDKTRHEWDCRFAFTQAYMHSQICTNAYYTCISQEEIDKARHEWEVERHRIYTRIEEERLTWDRKEVVHVWGVTHSYL